MSLDPSITLLCVNGQSGYDWMNWKRNHSIIPVHGSAVSSALSTGLCELRKDIVRVIFERSASSRQFLEFLSALPPLYRGDVLLIEESGDGFLSSLLRGDGRVLYQLSSEDVEFYLETSFASSCMNVISGQAKPLETAA